MQSLIYNPEMVYSSQQLDFTRETIELPDGPATLLRAPGVPLLEPATTALLRAVQRIEAGTRVFVMGPGATATALWAARSGARVTHWTALLNEAETLRATFAENQTPLPQQFLQADFDGLTPTSYERALLYLPRGNALQVTALQLTAALLKPRGRLYFVGATRAGVKHAIEQARDIFEHAGVLVRKGGYHASVARRPEGEFPLPVMSYAEQELIVAGESTRQISSEGVFAHGRLDAGAAALIAGMQIEAGSRVLDLGCGTGLVGLAALRQGADVTLVDVSARAVAATRRTLAVNGYPDALVYLSVGSAAVAGQIFDTVITNPPFHSGHEMDFEIAQLFIAETAQILRPGGALYLVVNSFLDYQGWLQETFPHVELAWQNDNFRVWRSTK
ncbi:MAG TPA: class I SAM-dependent methyltransferase [Thermoflexia bacterium]|nr:class I SAM-dependent methyltransferase [Thermoflexia bacterium]